MVLGVFLIGFLMLSTGMLSVFVVRHSKVRFGKSRLDYVDVLGLCLATAVGGGVITFFGTLMNIALV